ncbi:MAG: glutamine synthetase [Rhodospirillaceae bacterium]|nr:glutamine synthetase [Rhodospirillaceae bacterium]
MVCTSDISGLVRGKGFPASELPSRLERGVTWTSTSTMISPFGPVSDSPFGPTSDVMLMPDPAYEVRVEFDDGSSPEHFCLADLLNVDGSPWDCCPRHFLRRALADLEAELYVRPLASFEQEFVYTGAEDRPNYHGLEAHRRQGIFGEMLLASLRQAGLTPDTFLPQYGPRQYQVAVAPATGLRAADHAVILREITRATAYRLGHRAIFAPMLHPEGVGNGTRIHISFRDRINRSATYDASGPYGLSRIAAHFMAGVMHHIRAVCAVTAPSVVSYMRIMPKRWPPTYGNIGLRDRAASLRVCPAFDVPGTDHAAHHNVEFRPADATASPYLALGIIVHAGVDGIRKRLPLPPPTDRSPQAMSDEERRAAGIQPLPRSLDEALDALEATPEAKTWFGPVFLDAYLRYKRAEIRMLEGLDPEEQCERYAQNY